MLWLLVMILVADGRPQLVVRPTASQAKCEKTVEAIRSTRPAAVYDYQCIDAGKLAGIAA